MTSITHKRVEYTELFYDLVFVYAISKATALIHHLDNGMVTFESMLTFLLTLIILLNNWLIQTGFTNRHGKNSLLNMFVSFLNMGILLFISNLITQEWELAFQKFCLALISDIYSAKRAILSNDANIACLGAFTIGSKLREELIEAFLTNEFEPGCPSQPKVNAFRKYDLER